MFAKFLVAGCIWGAAMLFVLTIQVDPSYKATLVQSITDYLTTSSVLIVVAALAFASLLKWS